MKNLEFVALFMCMLIVNLPVIMAGDVSSGVVSPVPVAVGVLVVGLVVLMPALMTFFIGSGLASVSVSAVPTSGTVEVKKISGRDGVGGFRRSIYDYVFIEVEASFDDNSPVSAEDLKVLESGDSFDSCVSIPPTGRYYCTYKSAENVIAITGKITLNVQLFMTPSDSSAVDTQTVDINIDNEVPSIMVSSQPSQVGKNVLFSGTVTDDSSGIFKTEYFVGAFKVGETIFNTSEKLKDFSENMEIKTSELNSEEIVSVTINAFDMVGNLQTLTTSSFLLDNKPPKIVANSFTIYGQDSAGSWVLLDSIPAKGVSKAKIQVQVESSNRLSDVKATLSPLSSSYAVDQWVDATCQLSAGIIYSCVWENLKVDKAGNINSVIVNASDDLGNVMNVPAGEKTYSFESQGPQYRGGFRIVDAGTNNSVLAIGNFSDRGVKVVDIYLNLTDPNPGLNNLGILVDLSSLGGFVNTQASSCVHYFVRQEVTNILQDEWFTCKFANLQLKVNQSIASLNFKFVDLFGNENTYSISPSILFDNKKPEVRYLGAGHNYLGKEWIGPSDSLVVEIFEDGSGINESNVIFHVGSSSINASSCSRLGNIWTCTAFVAGTIPKTHLSTVVVSVDVKDNVGYVEDNVTRKTAVLTVDAKAPEVVSIRVSSTGFLNNKLSSGDGLKINLTINDSISLDGFANISALNCAAEGDVRCLENQETYGDCEFNVSGSNLWTCLWNIPEVYRREAPGIYEDQPSRVWFSFNISDIVGNSVINFSESIDVYGVIVDTTPDNFIVKVENLLSFPNPIDRLTLSVMPDQVPFKVYFPFYLSRASYGNMDATILREEITDCIIAPSLGISDYFSSPSSSSDKLVLARDVTEPFTNQKIKPFNRAELSFIKFDSTTANALFDFSLNCTLLIYQSVGDKIYKVPEKENVSFKIRFQNSALDGTPDQTVVAKVKEYRDSSIADYNWITNMAKGFKYLEGICSLAGTIQSVRSAFATLEVLGAGMEAVKFAPVQYAGTGLYKVGCWVGTGIGKVIDPIWYGSAGMDRNPFSRCSNVPNEIQSVKESATTLKDAAKGGAKEYAKLAWKAPEFSGRYFCSWVTCEWGREFWSKYTGGDLWKIGGLDKTVGDYNNVIKSYTGSSGLSLENSITPQSSIVFSLATGCIGGVFYNLNKYRQIQCKHINCMKEVATNGGDLAICDAKKQESYCLLIVGEFFELLGPVRAFKAFKDSVVNLAGNAVPLGLQFAVDKFVCKNTEITKKSAGPAYRILNAVVCIGPRTWYTLKDSIDQTKGLMQYGKAETWKLDASIENQCVTAMCDGTMEGSTCKCTEDKQCYGGKCKAGECDFGFVW